jgi:hypothetical protein
VVVAVVAMRMMQVTLDPVVHMVTVRHRVVAAAGAVQMARLVAGATMVRGAAVGVLAGHFDDVLVDMARMRVMQVAVVQVIDMPTMPDRLMAAAGPVLVRMAGVLFVGAGCHRP